MFHFLILFIVIFSLNAVADTTILNRAEAFLKTNNKSDHFRAYNDYKNLYLRAMMDGNEKLKLSSLQGIVKSGAFLRIDVSQYEKELKLLNPKEALNKSTSKVKTEDKEDKKTPTQSSYTLESMQFENEILVLKFDEDVTSKRMTYSTAYEPKSRQYRYVFDFFGATVAKSQELKKTGISKIRFSQFNKKTVRLVIENSKKLTVTFEKEVDKVNINLGMGTAKKMVKATPPVVSVSRNKVIVLDSGHGGSDPGAVGYKGYREKVVVLQVTKELRGILKSRGYKVHMTREGDKFLKLSERTKLANDKRADIFVSIHANAVEKKNADKANGVECYFLSKSRSQRAKNVAAKENSADMSDMNLYGKESFLNTINSHNIVASNKLAIDLQGGMLGSVRKQHSDVVDGGVREGPFWVLVGAQMPSVLVEIGFISHPKEASRLVDLSYQKNLALGLADGIERYFANN